MRHLWQQLRGDPDDATTVTSLWFSEAASAPVSNEQSEAETAALLDASPSRQQSPAASAFDAASDHPSAAAPGEAPDPRRDANPAAAPASAPAVVTPARSKYDEILRPIAERLNDRLYIEAARLFLDREKEAALPVEDELINVLISSFGVDLTARLVSGFVHFPCPNCRNGVEQCPTCSGNGVSPELAVCDACVGAGMARCDFCGGSGLATYSLVPAPLRYPVMARRVRIVGRQLKAMRALPLPDQEIPLLQTVLNFNMLLTMLENAITIADDVADYDPRVRLSVADIVSGCQSAADETERAMRSAIRKLADVVVTAPADTPVAAPIPVKVAYYTRLADSPAFEGTCLHHPTLATGAPSSGE